MIFPVKEMFPSARELTSCVRVTPVSDQIATYWEKTNHVSDSVEMVTSSQASSVPLRAIYIWKAPEFEAFT